MSEFPRANVYEAPIRSAHRRATFGLAWGNFFRRYFEFKGFASRSEFWWVQGPLAGLSLLLNLPEEGAGAGLLDNPFVAIPVLLVSLFLLIPTLSLHWRRLHDAGLAGPWWFLSLIPGPGSIAVLIMTLLPPRPGRQKREWA